VGVLGDGADPRALESAAAAGGKPAGVNRRPFQAHRTITGLVYSGFRVGRATRR
jgi:hypothetical protein